MTTNVSLLFLDGKRESYDPTILSGVTTKIGTAPRTNVLAFPLGTTYTDKYGPIEVDHADLLMVQHNHERRGRRLAWDIEHASHEGGPAEFQESQGWADLVTSERGVEVPTEWTERGLQRLEQKQFAYDSPVIRTWRGNHLFAIDAMSLVKDPARNESIPLLMSNASAAGAPPPPPSNKAKYAVRLHEDLGRLLGTMNEAQQEPDLKPLIEKMAAGITDPTKDLNQILQSAGLATEKPSESAAPEPTEAPSGNSPVAMSNRPDPLAVLGAEVMKQLGTKTVDETLGALESLKGAPAQLMSAQTENVRLMLLSAVHEGRAQTDEIELYKDKSPEYVRGLLSNRRRMVNTPAAASQPAAGTSVTSLPALDDMLSRTMGVRS